MLEKLRKVLFGATDNRSSAESSTVSEGRAMYADIDSLDKVLENSRSNRVLIFKHSTACGTSAHAKREMDSYLEAHPELEAYLVVVQSQRTLSNQIEEKLGVRHETPQLLLVEDGKASSFWSHYEIRKETLDSEL